MIKTFKGKTGGKYKLTSTGTGEFFANAGGKFDVRILVEPTARKQRRKKARHTGRDVRIAVQTATDLAIAKEAVAALLGMGVRKEYMQALAAVVHAISSSDLPREVDLVAAVCALAVEAHKTNPKQALAAFLELRHDVEKGGVLLHHIIALGGKLGGSQLRGNKEVALGNVHLEGVPKEYTEKEKKDLD